MMSSLSVFFILILITPYTPCVESQTVDSGTLARIIQFIETHYKRVGPDGHDLQYAVAINVPKETCKPGFTPTNKNFLQQDEANNVKNAINDEANALYQGRELVAAGLKKVVINRKKTYNKHSESLLFNPSGNSPVTRLLGKRKDGCVIFYTFNSPCVDTCIDENGQHSILKGLDELRSHSGPKAFVFKHIWKFDGGKPLSEKFKSVANRVPLYRCVSGNTCYPCEGHGNTAIASQCLP
ncbi:uncharacterized protein LOC115814814 [Chanos chanos]|uniref:Uncharacterized protein LOC115814814 n=1 Tax=Chanos chanos TaxID=29144 RepID=A0A6J2VNK7_CHACN|nr:uncharacterized protein LOC115814814 [Chanos chanos]